MEFRILGPLEVVEEGTSIRLGGARQRAVLALLLTRPNQVVSTDRLIDDLWGAEQPKTAGNTVQYYVSQLRKLLGADRITTRPPGYAIRVEPGELDLERFETLVEGGDPESLREALSLWRGPPLADFAYESFASDEIARLEELRLIALERRVDGDLGAGRHVELVPELEQLISEHPLRERLRSQLMLALYRSGRQAEALSAYQSARETLVDELGIEPGSALQQLQQAILQHDPSLDATVEDEAPERSIVVVPTDPGAAGALLALAEPLARSTPPREMILVALVPADRLSEAAGRLREHVSGLDVPARAAAFTSTEPASDIVRIAAEQNADLVLCESSQEFLADGSLGGELGMVLATAPCDVAVLVGHDTIPHVGPDRAVLVPFGGAEHDWAAVELAAWIGRASGSTLRLLGREEKEGRRDASRLLAQASLMIQRVVRVAAEPLLVPPGPEGVLQAADGAGVIVIGLSERWRSEGLGEARLALVREAPVPTLLVRKGLRPGGIAPQQTMTRFTWSLAAGRPSA
jgi:DNA-binding SARP family transcriptional activator